MKHRLLLLLFTLGLGLPISGCLHFQTKPSGFKPEQDGAFLSLSVKSKGQPQRSWKIHYRERGNVGNPTVVMIHGYGSSSTVWLPLMIALERMGYRTLAIDLPGFGLTDKYPGDYNTLTIARRVAQFMDAKGIKTADVLAHSWGSSVALSLRVLYPRKVRRIVIHSGWVYSAQIVPVIRWSKLPLVGEIIYGMFYKERPGDKFAQSVYDSKRLVTQPIVEKIKESFNRPGAVAAALAVARGMDFTRVEKKYHTIANPTLLIWGKQDHVALPYYGRRLVTHLKQAQLVFIDRCGHIPMIEQPYLVNRYVTSFLGPAKNLRNVEVRRR